MANFAEKVINFNKELQFSTPLYRGIRTMNPFKENGEIISIIEAFYGKFYGDTEKRKMILGINPGRLGAGITGIPFTDTKRLTENCGIGIESVKSHEPSSVFIYELIDAYGGSTKFYQDFYINSVCPLGFIEKNKKGNWVNRNYYDYRELFLATKNFIIWSLRKQIQFGIDTTTCYVLGKKNAKFLKIINDEQHLFDEIIVFDHPRYIVQYKTKEKDRYVSEYLSELNKK
ncbi:DUF4918 family protein [Flavobacteriaceae bacterium F89]|uniref:DUF4918 family protein n=1 Tax=Cerina litoralis TaxID=2874477 RepID=A0AAE3EVX2_9FLAO|nr:uracil-DNA glycosylase family protein [Cerina litoralis]MCG2460642.1 DUF4918 family protein [Cerina litoralis]